MTSEETQQAETSTKICTRCNRPFPREPNMTNHSWTQRMYCGWRCKMAAYKKRYTDRVKGNAPALGVVAESDACDGVPNYLPTPEEIERLKAEFRHREVGHLVFAGLD